MPYKQYTPYINLATPIYSSEVMNTPIHDKWDFLWGCDIVTGGTTEVFASILGDLPWTLTPHVQSHQEICSEAV